MHTVFALLCFVVVIHWLIFPYPPGLLRWHCGNLTIAPVPAKQPWWIWIYTSCEIIMNDYITTTMQSTKKPCAYFLGYTVRLRGYMTPSSKKKPWWRHQMESVFVLLAVCERNPPVTGGFLSQRASNTGFGVSFGVSLNKQSNKESCRSGFEKPGCSLWSHCSDAEIWCIGWFTPESSSSYLSMISLCLTKNLRNWPRPYCYKRSI